MYLLMLPDLPLHFLQNGSFPALTFHSQRTGAGRFSA